MSDYDYDFDLEDLYDDEILPGSSNVWYEDDELSGLDEYVERGIWEEIDMCMLPTVRDGFSQVGNLLLWCFIFRITTQTGKAILFVIIIIDLHRLNYFNHSPIFIFLTYRTVTVSSGVGHAISACTGLYILYIFFHSTMLHIVAFAFIVYAVLWLLSQFFGHRRGPVMGIVSIVFLIVR